MTDQKTSGLAAGWATFAGVLLMTVGFFHTIAGVTAVLEDEVYTVTEDWVFKFDLTAWGWIHVIAGVLVFLTGVGILTGNVVARMTGVVLASVSAIVNFAYMPWYPLWAIVMIAGNVAVIWALLPHRQSVW